MPPILKSIPVLIVVTLVAFACGTSNDTGTPDPTSVPLTAAATAQPTSTTSPTTPAPAPATQTPSASARPNAAPTEQAVTPDAPPPTATPTLEVIDSGTYLVPNEIDYGIYRVVGYWARLGSDLDIIANDGVYDNGLGLMVVQQGDSYIEISGEAVILDEIPVVSPLAVGYTEGTYVVGIDIQPGRYRVSNPDYAYAARLDATLDIIINAGNSGSVIIEVAPSDFAFTYNGNITPLDASTSSSNSSAAGTASQPAESDDVGSAILGSGTYLVVDEIDYGVYRVAGYWARLDTDFSIIDNDGVYDNGIGLMVVRQGDTYIEISGEATPLEDLPVASPLALGFTEGTYLVGVDIEPGRYRISDPDYAYAARLDSSLSIIDNAGNSGSVTIEIRPSDYAFTLTGAITPL